MKSLISFIAEEGNLPKENLATEVLAEIMGSPMAEGPLAKYLASFGCVLPEQYAVGTQERGVESRCIPDLYIRDNQDQKTVVIIESKFWAGLTPHQPNSYLDEISEGGLLLFVVPERRRAPIFHELTNRCSACVEPRSTQWQVHVGRKFLAVATWEDLLAALHSDTVPTYGERQRSRYEGYLKELEEFCDVESKEIFPPFTEDEVRGVEIAPIIHHLKWLAENIINRCLAENILHRIEPAARRHRLTAGSDTSIYFGKDLRIGGSPAWIGFWGSVWEELGSTPIWIAIDKRKQDDIWLANVRSAKGNAAVIRHSVGNDDYFFIPVPVQSGVDQETAVTSACQFIRELEELSGEVKTA